MPKNILYISDTGRIIGGGEISLLNLLKHLDRGSFRAMVCVPNEGDFSERVRALGIPVRVFSYRQVSNPLNLFKTVASVRGLADIIRQENIDLVHTNATGGLVLVAAMACRATHRPLVSHIRLINTGFIQDVLQAILSTKVVIISRRVGRKAGFALFRKKLALIYNGVDLKRFDAGKSERDFRKEHGIPEDAFLIGTAGAYVAGKGLEYLVQAVGLLKHQFPGLRAVVVGFKSGADKAYVNKLKAMAERAGVGETISFLDQTDDMERVFRSLDVFVFPSLLEPFGRVLIEAMACEKPVVAFDAGAVAEIVADKTTGSLVRPRDYRGLAEQTAVLLRDRETASRFGRNGRERCLQLFDITKHAEAVQRLYQEVLKDSLLGYVACPVCNRYDHRVINSCRITGEDASIAEKTLFLCRCRGCGLVLVNPQPHELEKDPAHLYDQDYFRDYMKFHSVAENGTLELNEPYAVRLELIKRFKSAGVLLDIGCASGEFMKASLDAGFSVKGVDISPYACEAARSKYNLDVQQGSFEQVRFPERSFDVISCADVLEHSREPAVFLGQIHRVLKDDGIIYLAVPDFGSIHYQFMSMLARLTRRNYFVLPHHLFHFSGRTLEKLLDRCGFTILTRMASESQIRVKGLRRVIMQAIFLLGKMTKKMDRLVLIAGKKR